ncbi:DUF1214 domain-containing protein [Aliiruegeria sabulilitoris]|uniref:DUF1214 domain-containing protein n=1 Tax=Aliiruegeria sabulilitoris TaxID=1510458 RepID=UPI00083481D1|nr:DUF1214 domain-containing protein [Aliiruegeria sabulilitoris]NDR57051.1 DUF1214 domain-containing protein [Pseudoruegeria sp. M32A2M]
MLGKISYALATGAFLAAPSLALAQVGSPVTLSAEQLDELVQRSYQYVAMFNVNNKMALDQSNPMTSSGYNRVKANTALADHTVQAIARPNNDTLYVGAMIDVTEFPMVMEIPTFDSSYVSLMVTGYDHYVNIPMSTRLGDFDRPEKLLFFSARTPGYEGAPVDGIDRVIEVSGDFVSAVFRVMPHASEPERMMGNIAAMESIEVMPLSEYLGDESPETGFVLWGSPPGVGRNLTLKEDLARFPPFGSDFEIFEDRLLEVMQFVFNHITFDPDDELDAALLAVYAPLGVVPGQEFDPDSTMVLDGEAVRAAAQRTAVAALERMQDEDFTRNNVTRLFLPKGQMTLETLVTQSVVGPIGQPAVEAVYPQVSTEDGAPMNAMHDYELVMRADALPPANAFWSATLYDNENGFFIPNDRFKYSVGENAGYKPDADGGIRIVISAEQPAGVPDENWLPINRGDYDIDVTMRLYSPDLERFATWTPPVARKLN